MKGLIAAFSRYCLAPFQLLLLACCTLFKRLAQGLRLFCQNSGIVGLRYLVEPNYHYSERILWCLLLTFAHITAVLSVLRYSRYYQAHAVQNIIEDQPELELVNFPTIVVCEARSTIKKSKMHEVMASLKNRNPNLKRSQKFEDFLNSLSLREFHKSHNRSLEIFYNFVKTNQESLEFFNDIDYKNLTNQLRGSCSELFDKCFWLEKEFDCCENFHSLNGMGQTCFALNSNQTEKPTPLAMKMSKFMAGTPQVDLSFNEQANIFLIGNADLPRLATTLPTIEALDATSHAFLTFQMLPTKNDAGVYELNAKDVNCMSPYDGIKNENMTYNNISYSQCLADCFRRNRWDTCGCIHYLDNEGRHGAKAPYCNLEGYACLERNFLFSPRRNIIYQDTIYESCLPSCDEHVMYMEDMDVIDHSQYGYTKPKVTILLTNFPLKRLRRQIIRGHWERFLLLSGIFTLITGCSIVHIVELLYCIVGGIFKPNALN